MKTIKDSVHDHIDIDGVARDLLDTPAVQRLRRISQLGTASFVYPSANHTRFEHSLGVYHLARKALESLDIEGQHAKRVEAAAILHDVGHAPFSHNVEDVLYRHTGKYHDEVHELLGTGAVSETLRDHDIGPGKVADLIQGDGKFGQLISGELDVDRMDYLVRDAHHTGVPYGAIDHTRLVKELTYVDGELVLAENNVQSAESLLIARALMTPTVYNHHVARISKSMLRRATQKLITTTDTDARTVRRMDDAGLRAALRDAPATESLAQRLDNRNLFKRAVWAEIRDVPEPVLEATPEQRTTWEQAIAERAGVDLEAVILDVQPTPSMTESTSTVIVNGERRSLDQQSPLVDALRAAHRSQWRLGVYAPEDRTDSIGSAAVEVLGLEIDGALVTDVRGHPSTLDQF